MTPNITLEPTAPVMDRAAAQRARWADNESAFGPESNQRGTLAAPSVE